MAPRAPMTSGTKISLITSLLAALVYGLIARVFFSGRPQEIGAFSVSFLLITPLVLGFLSVIFSPEALKAKLGFALTAPWLPTAVLVVVALVVTWELWFCIVLGILPIFILASTGGALGWLAWKIFRQFRGPLVGALVLVGLLPYLGASLEAVFPVEEVVRTVHSTIEIEAPLQIVWENITNLPTITAAERPGALFHLLGLPRPVKAEMACATLGCVRRGVWEHGLAFNGTITQIEPGVSYWVRLEADTRFVDSRTAPLAEIGGPIFGMVDDGYELEELSDGRVRLHLYSTYRVRTGVNGYAVRWLDFLMRDIQKHILTIEKSRSELQAAK